MGTPIDYLPPSLGDESIHALLTSVDLPAASQISKLQVTAEYHSIYRISFKVENFTENLPNQVVLRVAGRHLPETKTLNEVAIISWLSANTRIPVPIVIRYDASCNNPIGHEFIIQEWIPGDTLSSLYKELSETQLDGIIGGLTVDKKGEIVVGRVLEETFWYEPDIEKYWSAKDLEDGTPPQTIETLNIDGPFNTYVDYISAHMAKYVHAIEIHKSLDFMRPLLLRIRAFIKEISDPKHAVELNNIKLRLSHKDLHFANIMYDKEANLITAILDWEFGGIVPFTRWNPTRAFPWTARGDPSDKVEWTRLWNMFERKCEERGVTIVKDQEYSAPRQEAMQKAANFLRAIVEVCPRGQKYGLAHGTWKDTLVEQFTIFDV
ncbi:hypothetical protein M422DRAFT_148887 [Sphaerobolus stellatus SS14]|nr:hypothetical protein M422DRAFT_148887 [Sphaerobolus stellatus SS14]